MTFAICWKPAFFVFIYFCCGALNSLQSQDVATQEIGIVNVKPESGQFVDLENGRFMVPYTSKIPGTEIEFTMMPIPSGVFVDDFEQPKGQQKTVRIAVEPFWMAEHEVTWAEFQRYMKMETFFKKFNAAGVRKITEKTAIDAVTAPSSLYDPTYTYSFGDLPKQPASMMTQFSAKQYTKWLSLSTGQFYRLPYESEWEYACRAGTKTKFYFGDDEKELSKHAWFDNNTNDSRHIVGKLLPNPWGLYDMLGNVSEWTLDQFSEDRYEHLSEADLSKPISTMTAYRKPDQLYPRTLRGGSWESLIDECNCDFRLASDKDWKDMDPFIPQSPWWFTSHLGTSAGFRIIRPYVDIDSKTKESFWKADLPSMAKEVDWRIKFNGRGAESTVDKLLHLDIEKMNAKSVSGKD